MLTMIVFIVITAFIFSIFRGSFIHKCDKNSNWYKSRSFYCTPIGYLYIFATKNNIPTRICIILYLPHENKYDDFVFFRQIKIQFNLKKITIGGEGEGHNASYNNNNNNIPIAHMVEWV